MRRRHAAAALAVLLAGTGLAGCGSDHGAAAAMPAPTYASTSRGPLSLTGGWVSAVKQDDADMPGMDMSGMDMGGMGAGPESAAYATIHNAGAADALVGVSTAAAGSAGLHGTVTTGRGTSERMVRVRTIRVPAGGTLTLAPGGYHVMLARLRTSFAVGTSIRLTWRFRSGRTLITSFPVIDPADRPEESGS